MLPADKLRFEAGMQAPTPVATDAADDRTRVLEFDDHWRDFPRLLTLFTLIACVAPLGYLLDIDLSFATDHESLDIGQLHLWQLPRGFLLDEIFHVLAGAIEHALMEWSAVVIAFLCAIIAFTSYAMNRDIVAPIIGVALFTSGTMDLLHTLAATRLIDATADNSNLIPFSWAISRGYNATVMLVGVVLLLVSRRRQWQLGMPALIVVTAIMSLSAILLWRWLVYAENLPQTQFPEEFITRPYDVLPLCLYLACVPLYWHLYRLHPGFLTASLVIGLAPGIFSEAYMAFGSRDLFDHYFNSSHYLKVVAYLLPFLGYLFSLRQLYEQALRDHQIELANRRLQLENEELDRALERLADSNQQLERFAFICSHDLQEPIRMVNSFSELLAQRLGDDLDAKTREYLEYVTDGAGRAREMVTDILTLCRLDQSTDARQRVRLADTCADVKQTLYAMLQQRNAKFYWDDDLPELFAEPSQLFQLVLNLVGNGLKFNRSETPTVEVRARPGPDCWEIEFEDNGIGIDPRYRDRLFQVFNRLNAKSEFPGTGIGLAICKKIADRHEAEFVIDSAPGQGSRFILKWPRRLTPTPDGPALDSRQFTETE